MTGQARQRVLQWQVFAKLATLGFKSIYQLHNSGTSPNTPKPAKKRGSGCLNADHFRDVASRGYLPHPKSITAKGFYGEYFFDLGDDHTEEETRDSPILYPTYSFARCVHPLHIDDPSPEIEDYLAVGLNSASDGKNERNNLNLVVVLDVSGSMNSPFDKQVDPPSSYSEGANSTSAATTKLEIAKESLVEIVKILRPGDRFGIVLFDTRVRILQPVRAYEYLSEDLSDKIRQVVPGGGTYMKRGMLAAKAMLVDLLMEDPIAQQNDSRVLFLTDASPNGGGGAQGLMGIMSGMARSYKIYTTFIGVGLDFNMGVIDAITKVKASNYFSVHSKEQFHKVLVEDFNYIVTPIAFDAKLFVESPGLEMGKVYGSAADDDVGTALIEIDSIIATAKDKRGVKGSVILVRLQDKVTSQLDPSQEITLTLRYTDRDGKVSQTQTVVDYPAEIAKITRGPEIEEEGETAELSGKFRSSYGSSGIRKAILLARYSDYLKGLIEEIQNDKRISDSDAGIATPPPAAAAATTPLTCLDLSEEMASGMRSFIRVFKAEMLSIDDSSLMTEVDILDQIRYSRTMC